MQTHHEGCALQARPTDPPTRELTPECRQTMNDPARRSGEGVFHGHLCRQQLDPGRVSRVRMDRRGQVAQLQLVVHGNGNFRDCLSCPFANDACAQDDAVATSNDLEQTQAVILVHCAVDFADVEGHYL